MSASAAVWITSVIFALPVGDSGRFVRCAQGNHHKAHSMIVLSHERSCVRANLRDDPSRGTTWRSDISPNKPPDFDIPHHRDRQRPLRTSAYEFKGLRSETCSAYNGRSGCRLWCSRLDKRAQAVGYRGTGPLRHLAAAAEVHLCSTITSNDLRRL